jgi:hypothetical protein
VLRRFVQIAHERTGFRAGHSFAGVDFHSFHCGEIDHHAAVAHPVPETAVASTAHRQRQILAPSKIESSRYVRRTGTANDHRRTPIECAVENQASRFIVRRLRCDYVPANLGNKFSDRRRIKRSRILFACFEDPPRVSKSADRAPIKRGCG